MVGDARQRQQRGAIHPALRFDKYQRGGFGSNNQRSGAFGAKHRYGDSRIRAAAHADSQRIPDGNLEFRRDDRRRCGSENADDPKQRQRAQLVRERGSGLDYPFRHVGDDTRKHHDYTEYSGFGRDKL
jgi:hypothetical protein